MRKLTAAFVLSMLIISSIFSQGVNIPAPNWGLSFGNSTKFNGIRFNIIDKDIEKINGINISVWGNKESERQTGTVNGISLGIPAAMGAANLHGINLGLIGVGAKNNIKGINIGLLGAGAGNDAVGINFGFLGAGAGHDMKGLNFGGLGVGAGNNLSGINIGGLGAGAGGSVKGITVALLGAGAGEDLVGINLAGLGIGAGGNVYGINFGGIGVGAGESLMGINLAIVGIGAGEHLGGISIAAVGIGAPKITGLQIALASGGQAVRGITIAPAYFRVEGDEAYMKGLTVSAFNHIMGDQFGVTIGIFNYAWSVRGFQLGVLNHVKSNPKGLRWLPIFNTSF
jgi:hypothetical protein